MVVSEMTSDWNRPKWGSPLCSG